jgi:DNA-binding Lrp family transcriptional regulator
MEKFKNDLISLLKENARYTYKEMALMLSSDEKTVKDTVLELENQGVIVKYSAILNTEVMAKNNVQALIEVKVAPQKLNGFDSYAEEIYNFKEVKSLYLMSGGFDLAVFVEGNDLADIAAFISKKLSIIDGIVSVQTHFILKKYKIEGQITKPSDKHERQLIQA